MFSSIRAYIQTCTQLSEDEFLFFERRLKHKKIPKKTFLLQQGEVCNFEGFIIKGCIKTYFIDNNGFEVILTFATENWWVSDMMSFSEQKPSKMFIETLEDTELLLLTLPEKEAALQKIPALERMFRLMLQRHVASYQERIFAGIALSAEQRYDLFLQKYPHLPLRIPQHLIASYLGISPEFLSRLRKRKLYKNTLSSPKSSIS